MMWTKMTIGKWRKIDYNRKDIKEFIEAVKSFCHAWGQAEFNGDFTKFRRIKTFKQYQDEYESLNNGSECASHCRRETFSAKVTQYTRERNKSFCAPIFDPSKPFQNKLI